MTNEQYEKLVELVNSIEFIDKELIDTNKFIAKFHKIFSKDYELPNELPIYPWTNMPGVRDNGTSSAPLYEPIKIMYDGPPKYAPFYGINYFDNSNKTNGVDKMKFKVSDDSSGATRIDYHGITTSKNEIHTISDDNIYSASKTPLEILRKMETQWGEAPREVCCEDPEATLRSVYTDPKNLVTDDA